MLCESRHRRDSRRHPLNPYWARTCAKQGYKRAVVAIAQRLARILWRMWTNQEAFDVTKLNVVEQRRTRTRTLYWHIKKPGEKAVAA